MVLNMKTKLYFLALAGLIFFAAPTQAQDAVEPAPEKKKLSITPFPALFKSPEYGIGYGALVIPVYNFGTDSLTRNSSGQVLAYYTTKKQASFSISYTVYTNRENWAILGETRAENAPIFYYGTGNENTEEDKGLIDHKLFFTQNRILKQLKRNVFAGGQFQVNRISKVKAKNIEDSERENLILQRPSQELDGSTVVGLGPSFLFDSRDNVINAASGSYLELGSFFNHKAFGSEFNFNRYALDVRKFLSLDESSKHVLALQARSVVETGSVPFRELAFFGGHRTMRGFYEGRFRDKNMVMAQAEYRLQVLKRHGIALFGSAGQVAPTFSNIGFAENQYAGGLGYRFMLNTKEKINIRIDYAVGSGGTSGLYFAIGEAF